MRTPGRQLLHAARHLTGAKVLAARLYGVGPLAALAMACWLSGAGRFSSSRKAVRFAGLDVTVTPPMASAWHKATGKVSTAAIEVMTTLNADASRQARPPGSGARPT